jgi:hypothetical protein
MTASQVMEVTPGARSVSGETLGTGAKELVSLDTVPLGSDVFRARFFFNRDKRLEEVMLSLNRPESYHASSLIFDDLFASLRAKYGRELNYRTSENLILHSREATWISGRTNVTMLLMGVGRDGNDALLNLVYQVRVAAQADQL